MAMNPDSFIFQPGSENKALKKRRILWLVVLFGAVYVISYFFFMWQSGVISSLSLLVFVLTFHFVAAVILCAVVLYFLIGVLRKIQELEEPESNTQKGTVELTLKSDVVSLLAYMEHVEDTFIPAPKAEDAFVMEVKDILKKNLDNHGFKTSDLFGELAVSRAQLYRKFKSGNNTGVCEYLKTLRLNKALELLSSSNLNVTQVAFSVGFKNLSHFEREFFLRFGKTPKQMQKSTCNNPDWVPQDKPPA